MPEAGSPVFRFDLNSSIRDGIQKMIDATQTMYASTNNPLFAFRAYDVARRFRRVGVEVPPWVYVAFDGMSERLIRRTRTPAEWPQRVVAAMGFRVGKGRKGHDPFDQMDDACRRLSMAIRVRLCMDETQCDLDKAALSVAAHYGVAKSTVRKAYKEHEALVLQGTIEDQQQLLDLVGE